MSGGSSAGNPVSTVEPNVEALARLGAAVRDTGYSFTTITPRSHAIVNERRGNEEARSLRDVFGWSRPFRKDLLPPHIFTMLRDLRLLEERDGRHRSLVRFSSLGDTLYMHSAFPTEAKDAVFFGPDTYKFVDAIVDLLGRRCRPIRRAADICSGSGPGALTVAGAAPAADVFMSDINPTALRYAAANAALAGRPNAHPCFSDKLASLDGDFDIIVAHPPYLVDRTSRAYRHGGGALGADLSIAIVRNALERLAPGGTLLLFTGVAIVDGEDAFKAIIGGFATQSGCEWTYREVDPDVFGEELTFAAYAEADRIALVVFEATRREGSS